MVAMSVFEKVCSSVVLAVVVALGVAVAPGLGTAPAVAQEASDAKLAAESLGAPATLEGARIYVTTWDWNGPEAQYRALTQAGGPYEFGNGNGATDPLIMDDSAVVTLSAAAR